MRQTLATYKTLESLHQSIISCNKCPRLRNHCEKIATEKRRAYLNQEYWGKPIPGWGDPQARLLIVGLAPAAHGANRTGRIFTGDRSGDWLYRALFKAEFANQPTSVSATDGLQLTNCYISCAVRCAPPDNKPTNEEQKKCVHYLEQELKLLHRVETIVALGQIAYSTLWPLLEKTPLLGSRPPFKHGLHIQLSERQSLLLSYHPSQQNTFTRRLTEPMFDSVFEKAKVLLQK